MNITVNPLSSSLGAEVIGIDLNQSFSQDEIDTIYELLNKNKLLVFRNQSLSPEQQIAACRQFGEIELHPSESVPWIYRELTYVANTDPTLTQIFEHSGPPFELWHSDTCYLPIPARMSMLYAERVPSYGGETIFANMVQAYTDLPSSVKARLEHKQAVFGSGYKLMERCQKRGYNLQIPESEMEPDVVHPVIRTHPYTQEQSIFVNWAHTDCILDMPQEESDELLDYLYQHARQEQYIYEHHPQQGDVLAWDNASLVHSNTDKKLSEMRIMRRVMIKGTAPY
jgi:taurine dioxygenase